ncbi:MAG TPA: response regulator [Polyangiaceae bacterium]|nr:response regulator [Polyangiaceae bacterium]
MPRILVVEDSSSMRAFVRGALEMDATLEEVEVVEAASGFDALRLLPRGRYDLVITDINMPDINGLELVRFIRKSEAHRATPVLLISTQSSERDRERGLSLGANGYLAKPFSPEALREETARYLGHSGRSATGGGNVPPLEPHG